MLMYYVINIVSANKIMMHAPSFGTGMEINQHTEGLWMDSNPPLPPQSIIEKVLSE